MSVFPMSLGLIVLLLSCYRYRDSEQLMLIFAALLAVITMLLVPFLGYKFFDNLPLTKLYSKEMRVSEELYFRVCEPVIYAFVFGVVIFQLFSKTVTRMESLRLLIDRYVSLSWTKLVFIYLGLRSFALLRLLDIAVLDFFFMGISSGCYGVMVVMLRKTRNPLLWLIILSIPVADMIRSGMFQGHLAIMGVCVLIAGGFKNRVWFLRYIVLACLSLPILLIAKNELRQEAWTNGLSVSEVASIMHSKSLNENGYELITDGTTAESFEVYRRLNQGYILSAVIEKKTNSAELATGLLFESIAASLIPRLFWPDKPEAGGRWKIQKLTNLSLSATTSMNLSPFGDIIAEFGGFGAMTLSFLYALLLCKALSSLIDLSVSGRISFMIIPIILSNIYKVETDILTVLNFVVKGFVLGRILLFIQRFVDTKFI